MIGLVLGSGQISRVLPKAKYLLASEPGNPSSIKIIQNKNLNTRCRTSFNRSKMPNAHFSKQCRGAAAFLCGSNSGLKIEAAPATAFTQYLVREYR
jgi:hypothetical protein